MISPHLSSGSFIPIAVDGMGGDHGPSVVVEGVMHALRKQANLFVLLYGDERLMRPIVDKDPDVQNRLQIVHTDVFVRMDDKPAQALRQGRRVSSMGMALDAVKKGEALAMVSAGNTGALMAMARFCLRTLPGIDRPALAALWPTIRGVSIVLDVGASIGADAQQLVDLAIMGAAMARILLHRPSPTIGLLNVGSEEIKGIEEVKAAGRYLRETPLPHLTYMGFVEGDDLGKGTVDVVVSEGFTGNIALKTAEGTARQLGVYLKESLQQSFLTRFGAFLAKSAFTSFKEKVDPRKVNGAVFLGLEGLVIKSHGNTDSIGFSRAIEVAYDMAKHDLLRQIRQQVTYAQEERGEMSPDPPISEL